MDRLKVGIVGCGAISEIGHLPACVRLDCVDLVALADISRSQAQRMAKKYNISCVETDYRALIDKVDAVIVATPPHLHLEHAGFFLEHGVHVLCEKPMATTSHECRHLIQIADENHIKLAVGHVRRFFFYVERVKSMIETGRLGRISSITADEGNQYNWPAYTAYAFDKKISPGGVMFDLGLHVLDLFVWLLGPITKLHYGDDAIGGMESNASVILEFESGTEGRIDISRTGKRSNQLAVVGWKGKIQADVYIFDRLSFWEGDGRKGRLIKSPQAQSLVSVLSDQLKDFVLAILDDGEPRTPGIDGMKVVELVENCYEQARNRPQPKSAPLPGIVRWS